MGPNGKPAAFDDSKWLEFGYTTYYKPTKEKVYKVELHTYWELVNIPSFTTKAITYDVNTLLVTTWKNSYKVPISQSKDYLVRFEIGNPAEEILYGHLDTK